MCGWSCEQGSHHDQEVIGERDDVRAPLSQGRNSQGQHVQPKKQVLAKRARRDGCRKVHVGQRNKARLDPQRFRATQPLEGALLQNAQQFALRGGRKSRNFIQHDGAGAAELKPPELPLDSARECAFFVAE